MRSWSDPRRVRGVLWALLAISFLFVSIYRLSTAVIAEQLMATFDASGAELGTLHAVFFIVYAAMQIPTGLLVDRVGPRRTAATGAAVMHAGAMWFTLSGTYWGAIGARFLIGLGGSVLFVSLLRFCANWYSARGFAVMNGLSFAIGGVGGILATVPFAIVVDTIGWESTFQTLAGIGLLLGVAVAVFVRDSPTIAGISSLANTSASPPPGAGELLTGLGLILRDQFVWVAGVLLFAGFGINLTIFGLWGIPYIVQLYGTSVQVAAVFTFLGGLGSVLGPPIIGWIAGQTGVRTKIVILGGLIHTVAVGILALTGDPPLIVVAIAFFTVGFTLGSFVLTFPLIKERHPASVSGIALGTINGAGFVGAAALPTALGWILDAYWTGETVRGARVYTVTGYQVAFGIVTMLSIGILLCAIWLDWQSTSGATGSISRVGE